jgi:hypothetical protein
MDQEVKSGFNVCISSCFLLPFCQTEKKLDGRYKEGHERKKPK